MFVPNVFSFATEGRVLRYGSIRMPIDLWGPWRDEEHQEEGNLGHVRTTVESLMRPGVVLDILQNFTLFATDKKHRRIKVICRYQQFETTNKMIARVVAGYPKKGLIWHFQGSGKSLLMVFAAQKLRNSPALKNPTLSPLADADWVAAEVILSEKEVRDLIPALKRAGATGLVEYPLNKVIY